MILVEGRIFTPQKCCFYQQKMVQQVPSTDPLEILLAEVSKLGSGGLGKMGLLEQRSLGLANFR